MNFLSRLSRQQKIVAACFLGFVFLALLFGSSSFFSKDTPRQPQNEVFGSYAAASIRNSSSLQKVLDDVQYKNIRLDLTKYARDYKKIQDADIIYSVADEPQQKEDSYIFVFQYENKSHSLEATVKLLPNSRLNLSFKDLSSNDTSFDGSLSSNSQLNNYISKLPVSEKNYTIDFLVKEEKIVVTLSEKNPELLESIKNKIRSDTQTNPDIKVVLPGFLDDFESAPSSTTNDPEGD